MSWINGYFGGYQRDHLEEQFSIGLTIAFATVVVFFLLFRLDFLQMTFEVYVLMWCVIYIAMLSGIGIARYRQMRPLESKSAFLVSMLLNAFGMALELVYLLSLAFMSNLAPWICLTG